MNRVIGEKVLVVAELSANHNQNKQVAIDTIKAAKYAGADAVKLQTYSADTMTINCDNEFFRIGGGTPWEWHEELFNLAKSEGLLCFSTPFDKTAVDFLEEIGNPIYKIASFEITDIPLISYVASKGKPVIMSTGISNLDDIKLAVNTCKEAGNNDILLLKCTSSYPAPIKEANLLTIPDMRKRFGVEVGLSDHTIGPEAAITAVSLGARVIEKHFILDRKMGGPDSSFSVEPEEFKTLIEMIRKVESALGEVTYEIPTAALGNRKFSRSLFAVEDIESGELFTVKNIRSIRPGDGLHPKLLNEIIGRPAATRIRRGTPLNEKMVNWST